MALLGFLLLLLAAGAGYLIVVGAASLTDDVQVALPFGTLDISPLMLVITGAVIISIFWLGWVLLRVGLKRSARRRREAKEALRSSEAQRKESEARMQQQFAEKEAEVARERQLREQQASRLRAEADSRVKEQHLATETARQRAEVAERKLGDR